MNGKEEIIFEDNCIWMKNSDGTQHSIVMHDSEKGLMDCLAHIVTQNGGHILEIGFGMGLSATAIQKNPKVLSHTIIEVHPKIYEKALKWSKDKPNTKIILGSWQDILPTLDFKYNGILHDTHNDTFHELLNKLKPLCAEECILGFFEFFDENWVKDYKNFNIYSFEFTDEDFVNLPYGESVNTFYTCKIFDLQWITYKNGQFVKK
jgi:hypothetical protein